MSDGHDMLFVQADEHLRALVAQEVHETVVQPAEARPGFSRTYGMSMSRSNAAMASLPHTSVLG
jgi:hypothetical protein